MVAVIRVRRQTKQSHRCFRKSPVICGGKEASPYRVGAYKRAAETLRHMAEPVESIYRRDHLHGVIAIPTIGRSIGRSIEEYLLTERMSLLGRLRGEHWSDAVSVPQEDPTACGTSPVDSTLTDLGTLEY